MLKLELTTEFKKGLKKMRKRGADLRLLDKAIQTLRKQEPLPISYRDHLLNNISPPTRDLHIKPDWLLIYAIDKKQKLLFFTIQVRIQIYFNLLEQEVPYF